MITGTQKEIDRILPFMTGRLQKALAAVRDLDLETLPLERLSLTARKSLSAPMNMRRNLLRTDVRKSTNAISTSSSWQKVRKHWALRM